MSETKTITKEQYLQALGLFTLAAQQSFNANRYYYALRDHLDCDDNGHLSDAILAADTLPTPKDFDKALKQEGYVVLDAFDSRPSSTEKEG